MPKVRKPGWAYIYSDELKQEIAYSIRTGWVFCEDGTKYSPKEIEVIKENAGTIDLAAHLVKKTFKGELIHGKPRDNQGEHAQGRSGAGNGDGKTVAESVPRSPDDLQKATDREFNIF